MQARRSTMKNRGLPSSNRWFRRHSFSGAAIVIIFMILAAVVLEVPPPTAAEGAAPSPGQGEEQNPPEAESCDPETPERGFLLLEDPEDQTQYACYEVAVGDSFSITFIHSVNQSPETDCFEIREDGIYGVKTVYYNFGAGVPTEVGEGQTLTYGEDGSMILSGMDIKMNTLIYRVGTVSDHILALEDGSEISLRELCGRSAGVEFRFEKDEGPESRQTPEKNE